MKVFALLLAIIGSVALAAQPDVIGRPAFGLDVDGADEEEATVMADDGEEEEEEGRCAHGLERAGDDLPIVVRHENQNIVKERVLAGGFDNLRIKAFFDKSVDRLGDSEKRKLRQIVTRSIALMSEALKVRRDVGNMTFPSECPDERRIAIGGQIFCYNKCKPTTCGESELPSDHTSACNYCDMKTRLCYYGPTGAGIKDADFALYVTANRCRKGVSAYSKACFLEELVNRPIGGSINFCPLHLKKTGYERLYETAVHQLIHELGFSPGLFAFFHDENGNPRTPRRNNGLPPINPKTKEFQCSRNTIKEVTRWNWQIGYQRTTKKILMMVTPKVVAEARKQFDCQTLEGAEMELQGRSTAHWEERLFRHEFMTTLYADKPVLSRLTLALFEDSGWYKADYAKAELLAWGYSSGCDLPTKSCTELMNINREQDRRHQPWKSPFCYDLTQAKQQMCNHDRTATGICGIFSHHSPIANEFRHFTRLTGVNSNNLAKFGGSSVFGDYCPFVAHHNWFGQNTSCANSGNNQGSSNNLELQTFGSNSKCINFKGTWASIICSNMNVETTPGNIEGAGCYTYRCRNKKVDIILSSGESMTCDKAGQTIYVFKMLNLKYHQGYVQCPPCHEICGPEFCSTSSYGPNSKNGPVNNWTCD